MPLIFLLTILLILWIRLAGKHSERERTMSSSEFWKKEQEANFSRRTDIASLPYIQIPTDFLSSVAYTLELIPKEHPDHDTLLEQQRELLKLTDASILKLTGLSNTELKLRYGVSNLETLSRCDENFTRLCRVLNRCGILLEKYGQDSDAIRILSFAVDCGSDVQESYLTLARLYRKCNNEDAIYALLDKLSCFDELRRASLENALKAFLSPE